MENSNSELTEKIRQQFDTGPYPRIPLEKSPKDDYNKLFIHNFITSFYLRNQRVVDTNDKVILDAGCGTGYKTLVLAEANPGAKIVGIDLSEQSLKLAEKRLRHHQFDNVEFLLLKIEDLPDLGMQFDYINNDEVLYLFPDPATGLQAMKSVLKPDGIIRSNLHSSLNRFYWYRAQKLSKMMGLMDENPGELEIEVVRDTMKALKEQVALKRHTWNPREEHNEQWFMMNYLFQGDQGFTIPQMFSALRSAELEFISMINWRQWELLDLFKEPENLPMFWEMSLPELDMEDRLHLFELLHPVHRLLDFWCGHPNEALPLVSVNEWTDSDWHQVKVHLHPQLRTASVRDDLIECITNRRSFEISRYITLPTQSPIVIESSIGACLLPLWEAAQSLPSLIERWIQIRPMDPVTLAPVSEKDAFEQVKTFLSELEAFMYLLLERSV